MISAKQLRMGGMIVLLCAVVSILVVACARSGTSQGTTRKSATPPSVSSGSGSNCAKETVHTLASTFQEACATVAKGAHLTVIPRVPSFHILANGSWVHNKAQPFKEPGAPPIQNVQVTTNTVQLGPFTTAGTFHIYCTVHPGMELAVSVK